MTELFRICGVAVLGAVAALLIKKQSGGQAALVGVVALVRLLSPVLARYKEAISSLHAMLAETGWEEYGVLMFKSLGVGLAVKVTADVCRDLGEESLASALETAGRLEILLLCLPLMNELLATIREVMG